MDTSLQRHIFIFLKVGYCLYPVFALLFRLSSALWGVFLAFSPAFTLFLCKLPAAATHPCTPTRSVRGGGVVLTGGPYPSFWVCVRAVSNPVGRQIAGLWTWLNAHVFPSLSRSLVWLQCVGPRVSSCGWQWEVCWCLSLPAGLGPGPGPDWDWDQPQWQRGR